MDMIIGILLCMAGFLIGMAIYRFGVSDGLHMGKTGTIEKLVVNHSKPPGSPDPITQGLQNILSYDGEPQKKGGK